MRRPELIMSAQWPEAGIKEWYPADGDWFIRLHLPIQYLPSSMGNLPMAVPLEADTSGRLYLEADLAFLDEEICITAAHPAPDGSQPFVSISYEQLDQIIERAYEDTSSAPLPLALRVYRDYPSFVPSGDPPARRYAGFLRMIDHAIYPFTSS